MVTHNKPMHLIATKLGLGDEENVLKKAAEFERLLQTKSTPGISLTDTSKTVICLDLAAVFFGADLDNKAAFKYAGLKGSSYLYCRKVVENLLELNCDKLTVPKLCLTLQCSAIQALAKNILKEYQRVAKTEIDLNLPQYVCMAVYQACRLNKVKISRSKIIEKSRLKPAQWSRLDAEWTKFVEENLTLSLQTKGRLSKTVDQTGEITMDMDTQVLGEENSQEPEIEPYEVWKKRIIEAAYKELEEMKKKQAHFKEDNEELSSPRRSPRKTPQKSSFNPTPRKTGGIRLIFPKNL